MGLITGILNVSKIGDIFGTHEPEQKKVMMTIASRINEISRKIKETPTKEIDWAMWEERYTSIGYAIPVSTLLRAFSLRSFFDLCHGASIEKSRIESGR